MKNYNKFIEIQREKLEINMNYWKLVNQLQLSTKTYIFW